MVPISNASDETSLHETMFKKEDHFSLLPLLNHLQTALSSQLLVLQLLSKTSFQSSRDSDSNGYHARDYKMAEEKMHHRSS